MSPSVPIAQSRQIAIDRIIEVMVARFAAELTAIADTNLYLPAPGPNDYFDVPQDPDQVIQNHNVAVFVYPSGTRTKQASGSGGGGTGEMQRRVFPVDITVLFRRGMYDPTNKPVTRSDGKVLIHDEVLKRRAERYTGAMINVILSTVCGGTSGIVDRELNDDMPEIFFDAEGDKPLWGIGSAQFDIIQKVNLPFGRSL